MARSYYSVSSSTKATAFKLNAPQAKKVSLAGTFNNWDPNAHLAKKGLRGTWSVNLSLRPGRYEYKFLVDGNWVNDSSCKGCVTNAFGSQNCIIEVR